MSPPSLPASVDLQVLRIFLLTMRERNATRVARRLGISQPAVSHALRKLREAVDDPLFVRSPSGLTPTSRAFELEPLLRDALASLAAALVKPGDFDPSRSSRTFRLAMPDSATILLLPSLLTHLAPFSEHIAVNIVPPGKQPFDDLQRGDIDLLVALSTLGHTSMKRARLFRMGYACVHSTTHPLAEQELSIDTYVSADHIVVAPAGNPGSLVDEHLATLGRSRHITARVPYFLPLGDILRMNHLVATVPERIAGRLGPDLVVRPPPMDLPDFELSLWWTERAADPAHHWIRQFVKLAASLPASPDAPLE